MERNKDESFEAYKERRARQNELDKIARRGKVFHDSYVHGTYNVGKNKAKRASK